MAHPYALQGARPRANESDPIIPVKIRYDAIVGLSLHKMKMNNNSDAWVLVALTDSGHEVVVSGPETSFSSATDLVNSDYNGYLQQ